MIPNWPTILGGGLLLWVGAYALHEVTHLTAARLAPGVGLAAINVYGLWVEFDVDEDTPRRVEEAIGIAPTTVGSTAGVLVVAIGGWPAPTPWTLAVVAAWGIYTFPSVPDLIGHYPPDERAALAPCARTIQFAALSLFGWVVAMIGWGVPLQLFGLATALAGVALLGEALWQWERRPEVARAGA